MRDISVGRSLFGLSSIAAAAALLTIDVSPMPRHQVPRKRFDTGRPSETTRKQFRAADRSRKQYLLKGIRP